MNHRTYSSTEIATRDQLHAEISGHGDHVEWWVIDGHKVVIGHHCQQNDLLPQMCKTGRIAQHIPGRKCLCLHLQYLLAFWRDGRGVTEIHKGQVAEEKVHGGVESRADLNQGNHAQVSQNCGSIDGKKEQQEEDSELRGI